MPVSGHSMKKKKLHEMTDEEIKKRRDRYKAALSVLQGKITAMEIELAYRDVPF